MSEQEKRKDQKSILTFFKKVKCENSATDCSGLTTSEGLSSTPTSTPSTSTSLRLPDSQDCDENDIGVILKKQIGDEERRIIMERPWLPNGTFKFPSSGPRNLKFNHQWLLRWKWLLYSKTEDGAYCKYCSIFSTSGAGKGQQPLGFLVKKPFSRWKNAIEQFDNHENTVYHKNCVLKAEDWAKVDKRPQMSVEVQQNSYLQQQIEENRKAILPIIETVMLCGRQGIALRGHRDSGPINIDETPIENDGNFRALLRFRVSSGDTALKNHLETGSKNALYLSPKTQNEIVNACNDLILKELVDMVNSAECFTLLADETTDMSTKEQASIGVRYLYDGLIREDFLQFVPVYDLTGKGLATVVLNSLKTFGIETKYLRGQGYDGASSMSGKYNGTQAFVQAEHPTALYVHCASHSLNLAISASCSVAGVRNCCDVATKVCVFFNTPKRMEVLGRKINDLFPQAKSTRLKQFCATRWVERHDAILLLQEMLPAVHEALEEMSLWENTDSSSAAMQLSWAIKNTSFLISLQVLAKVFSLTLPLARSLQLDDIDLLAAMDMVDKVNGTVSQLRIDGEQEFATLFKQAETMANSLGCTIAPPRRTASKQKYRCNVEADTTESYYRISIYYPFVDHFISELKTRFLNHKDILGGFSCLLPIGNCEVTDTEIENMKTLVQFYGEDLLVVNDLVAVGELKMWYERVNSLKLNSKKALNYFDVCHKEVFPTVHRLLKILVTLPVSTSTSERSFSTLRRLKTYLRSTMGQDRLNGLALLNIHRELGSKITADDVLNELAKTRRRLEFRVS